MSSGLVVGVIGSIFLALFLVGAVLVAGFAFSFWPLVFVAILLFIRWLSDRISTGGDVASPQVR